MSRVRIFGKVAVAVGAVWAVAMVAMLVTIAGFNQPIADQYNFMSNIRDNGVLGYTGTVYTTWSGRLVQTLGLGLGYKLFGDGGAQVALPVILLVMLGLAASWLIYQLLKAKEQRVLLAGMLGFLLAGGVLYTTSCLFDVYLWLDAAFVYLLGLVAIVYDMALGVWLVQHARELGKHKILITVMLAVAVLLQTAGETSMVVTAGWSLVMLAATIVYEPWRKYRMVAGLMFGAMLLGGLVMVCAPGLWSRAGYTADDASLIDLVVKRPLHAYWQLAKDTYWWQVGLTVVAGMTLGGVMRWKVKTRQLKWGMAVCALVALSLTYVPFVVYFFGSRSDGVEARALAVPAFGLFAAGAGLVALATVAVLQRYRRQEWLLTVAIVAVATVAGMGFLKFNKGYLAALVTRDNLVMTRLAEVGKYQRGEVAALAVPDAPVMISNSGATDFSHNGWVNVDWFFTSFARYYGIDTADLTAYGERLVNQDAKEDWYIEKGRNECVITNVVVFEKYYCEVEINNGEDS